MPRAYFKSDDELFEAIQRCRTSSMTDKEWCKANGMSQTSFYRYIKRLKEASHMKFLPISDMRLIKLFPFRLFRMNNLLHLRLNQIKI
ncbi:hypothetical protein SAMN05216390_1349 [Lachnospiraceae bacterium KH1T2]|nr:hypothetical protein SAMN05216390_1349 [Lachnospiraceae bacterium KH1T2]